MLIHTNLQRRNLTAAAQGAGVGLERLDESGSRTHPRKFDVILSGSSGRRANFGGDHEAATWDEWGIFLDLIFQWDPDARAQGYYEGREQFRWATGHRFDTLTPDTQHQRHRWHLAAPGEQRCRCGAVRRWDPPRRAQVQGISSTWTPAADAPRASATIDSRYESDGRYRREFLAEIDAVLADA